MSSEENVVWKGRSSQIVNFWPLVISLLIVIGLIVGAFNSSGWLAVGAVLPAGYGGWIWLQTKCKVFEFTSERIRIYEGVFNQEINEVELYRVKDTKIQKPFWLRLFGLSSIVLSTSDRSCPTVEIKAIKDGPEIREKLRKQVEMLRDKKRVREVDFEGSDGDEMEFEGGEI
ncbi:PH domain-containing protein [Akkermansiaceae bacterium]|nr:PH domain-containing protein [Akkermansiaceae bacterium]